MIWTVVFLMGLSGVLLLHIWLRRPLCEKCAAEAMPNVTSALVRAHHHLDSIESLCADWKAGKLSSAAFYQAIQRHTAGRDIGNGPDSRVP